MTTALRRFEDVPNDDAPEPRKKTSPGILALLAQVADQTQKIAALKDDIAALAARLKLIELAPRTIQNHVHVKDRDAPAAPVVNLPPMEVHVAPAEAAASAPKVFVHDIERNSQGRPTRIYSREVEPS